MAVDLCPQLVLDVSECTLFVTRIVGKFDKDTAILLVWLKGEDLETVLFDHGKARFQFL